MRSDLAPSGCTVPSDAKSGPAGPTSRNGNGLSSSPSLAAVIPARSHRRSSPPPTPPPPSRSSRRDRRRPDMLAGSQPRDRGRMASMAVVPAATARTLLALTLVLSSLLRPALAVLIPFENCLPESYQLNDPTPLQWVPLAVDAVFDLQNASHNLRVVVYGNVTGSFVRVELPPPTSPDWTDPLKTDGKILDDPDPLGVNRATTLHSKVNVLTYEPFDQNSYFCADLVNGSCPLAPVFNTTSIVDWPYSLPAFNLSNNFDSTYAFASFAATFLVIYGDASATNIGCVSATITPDLGNLKWMLKFLPLVVLLFVGFATILAGNISPWGSTDIFHWTSNYGRDADLLRLVTPGFGDCLQYIQFVVLTGSLTLSYPGFYQPMASQVGWSTLMFNESFVSHAAPWQSVVDGIYVTNSTYGLQSVGQLIGMANVEDIWAGMVVWLLAIIAAAFVLIQAGFLIQWTYRKINSTPEEDLRAKNIPFSLGNVVRIVFNYFLLPIVALSTFQLVVSNQSPAYTVALASLTLVVIIGFAAWLLYLIIRTRPRAVLFDDLPTVLLYGPLYNTYSDEAAAFALIPVLLTFMRGIAVGAVQPFGIAQLVLLAICEVIQILTLHAFRPFHSPTSMNAYHTICAVLRFFTILLMVAFIPTLGVTEGPKGWIGYAILLIHGMVLVFGFFLNALQTIAEVVARRLGAGGDDEHGLTRGGLSKIFGMRQLSRRIPRRGNGPSRSSQLSSTAMLDAEEGTKQGYVMPGGRIRSESAGSVRILVNHSRHRSSSAFDSIDVYSSPPKTFDAASSFAPTTPGEASTFSFLPSPNTQGPRPQGAVTIESATGEPTGPYYRPPRRRRDTVNDSSASDMRRGSVTDSQRAMQLGGPLVDPAEIEEQIARGATPAPYGQLPLNLPPRADYAHREVDFYYGVRGPALNSDGPGRKLGTGPADPTGPMATATGWFRTLFGAKTKEKGKGFEVVRSARMPEAMKARGGDFGDDAPPEGIPVAMGVLRNGPIDSDDDEPKRRKAGRHQTGDLLDDGGDPQDSENEGETRHIPDTPPRLPDIERGESLKMPSRIQSKASRHAEQTEPETKAFLPNVPRRSSRRLSNAGGHSRRPSVNVIHSRDTQSVDQASSEAQLGRTPPFNSVISSNASRLPFERAGSQKRRSYGSSMGATDEFSQVDLNAPGQEERPTSYGIVPQHSISRIESGHLPQVNLLESSAEVVDERARSRSPHH